MTIYVTISDNSPSLEALEITETRPKAYKVRNKTTGAVCWLPKSGLAPRKPGVASYEDEYTLKAWFRSRLDYRQERALGIAE